MIWLNKVHFGDCLETLRQMRDGIVNTCVTSPPYFGLRQYLPDGVRLKNSLSEDQKASIAAELRSLGITPIDHTP